MALSPSRSSFSIVVKFVFAASVSSTAAVTSIAAVAFVVAFVVVFDSVFSVAAVVVARSSVALGLSKLALKPWRATRVR